jgi:hypothetical protein
VWLDGQYTSKIFELHKQYGPIIRISPSELHICDPVGYDRLQCTNATDRIQDFYDTVYASSASQRRIDKDPFYTKFIGLDLCIFSTVHHELHRQRRSALQPYFSTANVRRLQPVIQERLGVMMKRVMEFAEAEKPLNVSCMFSALGNGKLSQSNTNC